MRRHLLLIVVTLVLGSLAAVSPLVLAQTRPLAGGTPLAPAAAQQPAVQAPGEAARVSGLGPGFYVENSLSGPPIVPGTHSATGSFRFWDWKTLNPDPGVYNFTPLDNWIQLQLGAGYQYVGIAVTTYSGRAYTRKTCTPLSIRFGVSLTPEWVRNGPDGEPDTADDPIIISSRPLVWDCNQDGTAESIPWPILDYQDPYYRDQYRTFINALAEHLRTGPYVGKVAWVAAGTGKDGENKPVDDEDDTSLGLTATQWVNTVEGILTDYKNAFMSSNGTPAIRLLVQNAPFYLQVWERRDVAKWASDNGIGLAINNITSDFDFVESCNSANTSVKCAGIYDQARQYSDKVPVALESYDYMMETPNEFYWSMARALDVHTDFIRLSNFWTSQDNTDNRTIAEWTDKYMGVGLQAGDVTPPSIWSRMREHRDPCFLPYTGAAGISCNWWPTNGNYEYYLRQVHTAPGGVTIPYTDDERYNVAGRKFGWDHDESNVLDKPYHYNTQPYDPVLRNVGLYSIGAKDVQVGVDPGWTARRSDQATGNFGFFFDADDRYLSPPTGDPHQVAVAVTYLDYGSDRWRLRYDSTTGEKSARVYAIQNWTISVGLAIDPKLPTAGLQPANTLYIQKTNSSAWKTATFLIEDGYFGNRLSGGTDFYLDSRSDAGAADGNEYIHHVDLRRLNNAPQVTPTPTPTTPVQVPTSTPTPTPTATPISTKGIVSGYVFEDVNLNGNKEGFEPPLPGALVDLALAANPSNVIRQSVTDNNGFYRFTDVVPAIYVLRVNAPAGWEIMLLSRYVQTLAGQESTNNNFPSRRVATPTPTVTPTPSLTPTATSTPTVTPTATPTATTTPTGGRIEGTVWHDSDHGGEGDIDPGEVRLAGVTLRLRNVQGVVVSETQTDDSGHYAFLGLASQTYELLLVLPAGWEITTPPLNRWLAPGVGGLTADFGVIPTPTPTPTATAAPSASLHAFVWNDANKDGIKDEAEPPLTGATVIVYTWPGQQEVARVTSGGDGFARFLTLPAPATYKVVEQDPLGMDSSTTNELLVVLSPDFAFDIVFGDYEALMRLYVPLIRR